MTKEFINNIGANTNSKSDNNRMIDQFTNRYSLSKTLRFSLEPIGETRNFFDDRKMLETDEQRANDAEIVKGYLKDWFKYFIDDVFNNKFANDTIKVNSFNEKIKEYDKALRKPDYDDVRKIESELRKIITDALIKDARYNPYFKGKDSDNDKNQNAKFINKQLLKSLDEEKKDDVNKLKGFYTYFNGFFTNIKNMFSSEEQNTAIAHRCINVNLPLFYSNIIIYNKIKDKLRAEIGELNTNFSEKFNDQSISAEKLFNLDFFSSVLSQRGIDDYNSVIGGYSYEDGTKIKGLNEYINLYNQTSKVKLPFMNQLKKQILSDSESFSFIPENFKYDNELLKKVKDSYSRENGIKTAIDNLCKLIKKIDDYDDTGIFISTDKIKNISQSIFNDCSFIKSCWVFDYDSKIKRSAKKRSANKGDIDRKREDAYKKIKSFSIAELQKLIKNYLDNSGVEDSKERIIKRLKEFEQRELTEAEIEKELSLIISVYLKHRINALKAQIEHSYDDAKELFESEYQNEKKLQKNDEAIDKIRSFLDSIKEFENLVKMLTGSQKEPTKDDRFYGDFIPSFDSLRQFDTLYNKVRNYLTAKPYSTEKIKLNFDAPQLLAGWDINKEGDHKGIFLMKDGEYFLGIINKESKVNFSDALRSNTVSENYQKMVYKSIRKADTYFSVKNIRPQNPPEEILNYLDRAKKIQKIHYLKMN